MLPSRLLGLVMVCVMWAAPSSGAQERAYFVTYDHYLEEPGNLEIAVANTSGFPRGDRPSYNAPWIEIEYGLTGWWTTELYVEGATFSKDGGGFTGWRWEHRFRPLKSEHRINPVLYVEYERINEASRIQKEIIGSGSLSVEPFDELRREQAHELEAKLILSSAVRGWNVSENLIFEKNLSKDEGVELGYAVGVSRPLGTLASGSSCRLCRENFVAGIEAYGGLGSTEERGVRDTRHFLAPVLAWRLTENTTVKFSTGFGLTDTSDPYMVRVGWACEFPIGGRR